MICLFYAGIMIQTNRQHKINAEKFNVWNENCKSVLMSRFFYTWQNTKAAIYHLF